ncbi:MAG: hypothetical protein ACQZ3N_01360 [cyanobacterium endosymbiont of Rhopalodia yunnanensis]
MEIHSQSQLLELLKRLQHDCKLTMITVLHDINLAVHYSDRLSLLK